MIPRSRAPWIALHNWWTTLFRVLAHHHGRNEAARLAEQYLDRLHRERRP